LQLFLGGMAVLQFFAFVFNLLPVPPLDGFHALEPYLPSAWSAAIATSQIQVGLLLGLFFVLRLSFAASLIFAGVVASLRLIGFNWSAIEFVLRAYTLCLFGRAIG
jgi:Zn-dependent protease